MPTIRYCFCDHRIAATERREFLYLPASRSWYFADGDPRRMTDKARWLGGERGVPDHEGEPTTYECCPWCGGDLPGVVAHYPVVQADGEDGG